MIYMHACIQYLWLHESLCLSCYLSVDVLIDCSEQTDGCAKTIEDNQLDQRLCEDNRLDRRLLFSQVKEEQLDAALERNAVEENIPKNTNNKSRINFRKY